MLKINADEFVRLMYHVDNLRAASLNVHAGEKFVGDDLKFTVQRFDEIKDLLNSLEMPVSYAAAHRCQAELSLYGGELQPMKWVLRHLYESILSELAAVYMFFIPKHRAKLYDRQDIFGAEVSTQFADTTRDIEEAAKCVACARWTAAVFHLMRGLERGLQKMAVTMGIAQPANVAFSQWGEVIDDIEKELDAIRNAKKSPQKSFDLQRYSELATDFRYFKNAYRNHVMHSRSWYDEETAMQIFQKVESFMKVAATVLK